MEVKQTGHCFLIIPLNYKSFQEKKKRQDKEFFKNLVLFFSCEITSVVFYHEMCFYKVQLFFILSPVLSTGAKKKKKKLCTQSLR